MIARMTWYTTAGWRREQRLELLALEPQHAGTAERHERAVVARAVDEAHLAGEIARRPSVATVSRVSVSMYLTTPRTPGCHHVEVVVATRLRAPAPRRRRARARRPGRRARSNSSSFRSAASLLARSASTLASSSFMKSPAPPAAPACSARATNASTNVFAMRSNTGAAIARQRARHLVAHRRRRSCRPPAPGGVRFQSPSKRRNGPRSMRTASHSGRRFGLRVDEAEAHAVVVDVDLRRDHRVVGALEDRGARAPGQERGVMLGGSMRSNMLSAGKPTSAVLRTSMSQSEAVDTPTTIIYAPVPRKRLMQVNRAAAPRRSGLPKVLIQVKRAGRVAANSIAAAWTRRPQTKMRNILRAASLRTGTGPGPPGVRRRAERCLPRLPRRDDRQGRERQVRRRRCRRVRRLGARLAQPAVHGVPHRASPPTSSRTGRRSRSTARPATTRRCKQYTTTIHGRARAQGSPVAATCANCHGTHDIKRSARPRLAHEPRQSRDHLRRVPRQRRDDPAGEASRRQRRRQVPRQHPRPCHQPEDVGQGRGAGLHDLPRRARHASEGRSGEPRGARAASPTRAAAATSNVKAKWEQSFHGKLRQANVHGGARAAPTATARTPSSGTISAAMEARGDRRLRHLPCRTPRHLPRHVPRPGDAAGRGAHRDLRQLPRRARGAAGEQPAVQGVGAEPPRDLPGMPRRRPTPTSCSTTRTPTATCARRARCCSTPASSWTCCCSACSRSSALHTVLWFYRSLAGRARTPRQGARRPASGESLMATIPPPPRVACAPPRRATTCASTASTARCTRS